MNNLEIFEDFNGTKESKKKLEAEFQQRRMTLDTVKAQLQSMELKFKENLSSALDTEVSRYRSKKEFAYQLEQEFETEYSTKNSEYTNRIWEQINKYVYEYGDENDYYIIHGASGNGSIMYGSETADITKEVLEYVNGKYEGL